jgi:hypothetical protein
VPPHTQPHRQEDRERVPPELHREERRRVGRQAGTAIFLYIERRAATYLVQIDDTWPRSEPALYSNFLTKEKALYSNFPDNEKALYSNFRPGVSYPHLCARNAGRFVVCWEIWIFSLFPITALQKHTHYNSASAATCALPHECSHY